MQEQKQELKNLSRTRKIISILSLFGVILLLVVLTFTVGTPLLQFISQPELFREWVQTNGALGPLSLVGIQLLQVVIAFIPGEVVEIGAGYAFGAINGTLLCLVGTAVGSVVIYGFTRKLGYKMVTAFVSPDKISSMKFLQSARRLNLLIFILFFIPGTPKDLITYFIGLTPMKLPVFLLISSVARIPSVISSTIGGDALGTKDYTMAVIVFAATALISGVGLLVYHKISKHKEAPEHPND